MNKDERETTFMAMNSMRPVRCLETIMIVGRQQLPMIEPYKLFIPRHIAPDFQIEDVRVGNRSMFPMGQSLTAEQFCSGDGHVLKCEPLHIGMDFIMQITNISGCERRFSSSWACYLPREVPPAFEKQEGMLDRLRRVTDETLAKSRETIQKAKDIVEEIVYPGRQAKSPRQLPKPKDPPSFGWDPGYGDD